MALVARFQRRRTKTNASCCSCWFTFALRRFVFLVFASLVVFFIDLQQHYVVVIDGSILNVEQHTGYGAAA
jgi:hypothetical protein